MRFLTSSVFGIAMLFLCGLAGAAPAGTIFYVSPTGNDSNDGRAPEKAWQTAAKVNATRFAAGDQVLFARGGQWRESLLASSSGTAENPIVYAAFGEGRKPKFWGSDLLKNADFTLFQGTTYKCRIARRVASVLVDQQFLLAGDKAAVLTKPNTWFWEGGTLYLNPGGKDPRSDHRLYSACVRVDCVHSNGKNHLVFRDLVGDESADARDGYAFRVMGSDNVRLENCEAYRAGRHHFGTINSSKFTGVGLHCAHAMPNIPGGATFYVSFSDASRSGDSHQWIDCSAEHFENPNQGSYQVFYDHGEGLGPILIQNMKSRGGKFSVGTSAKAPVTIKGGVIEDASLEIFGTNARVDGLTIRGNGAIDHWGSDCLFQNVLLANIKPKNGGPTGYGSAIVLRDGAKRNTIRFCTIAIDPAAPVSTTCLALLGKGSATRCYGNILQSKSAVMKSWAGTLAASDLAQTDYNLYNAGAVFTSSDNKEVSWDAWQALGFDAHSLRGDPLFADTAAGNFVLKAGSPACRAAKVESALKPETDLAGKRRPAAACDIGAHQFSEVR